MSNGQLKSGSLSDLSDKLFKAAEGYILRNVVGEYLLIPVALDKCDTSKVSILNETGAFLWECLAQRKSFDALAREMTEEFEVSPAQANEDVEEFLHQLINNGLINVETEVM